jgi:hypothetical protein
MMGFLNTVQLFLWTVAAVFWVIAVVIATRDVCHDWWGKR